MSDLSENIVTASIDDYLLALADGIYKAQRQLSQVSIDGQPGAPAITYQLPRVDFEFRVSFALSTSSETGGKALQVRPVNESSTRSATVSSLIKGSFVAVPAGGGRPATTLRISPRELPGTGGAYAVEVHTVTALGEDISNVDVQFNIDPTMSSQLSAANGAPTTPLRPGTYLQARQRQTDPRGRAYTTLHIDSAEEAGRVVVVVVDGAAESRSIAFEVKRGST